MLSLNLDLNKVNQQNEQVSVSLNRHTLNFQNQNSQVRKAGIYNTQYQQVLEKRKQNQVLISINCSKAINQEHYQELMDIVQKGGTTYNQPQVIRAISAVPNHSRQSQTAIPGARRNKTSKFIPSLIVSMNNKDQLLTSKRNRIQQVEKEHFQDSPQQAPSYHKKNNSSVPVYPRNESLIKRGPAETFDRYEKEVIKMKKGAAQVNAIQLKYIKDHLKVDHNQFTNTDASLESKRLCQTEASPSKIDTSADYSVNQSFNKMIKNNEERLKRILGNEYQDQSIDNYGSVQEEYDLAFNMDKNMIVVNRQMMYSRAMKRLKNNLEQKGLTEKSLDRSKFGLIHFHIDAFNDKISLNKFETDQQSTQQYSNQSEYHAIPQQKQSLLAGRNVSFEVQNDVLIDFSRFASKNDQSHRQQDEQEDIHESMAKNSPQFRQKRKSRFQGYGDLISLKAMNDNNSVNFSSHQEKLNEQRTALYTKEVNDTEQDFIGIEINELSKFENEELQKAYNRLAKATRFIFSGSINPLINKVDIQRAVSNIHRRNDKEQILIDELMACKDKLDKKQMLYGIWSQLQTTGSLPNSREGSTSCVIDNSLYIFGGFSTDIFNDMKILDLNYMKWKSLGGGRFTSQIHSPRERFSHSMVAYERKLIVFGGAGQYVQTIKMRMSFNDVNIFDTMKEDWKMDIDGENAPKKRMNHSASIMGCLMLVHGGFNTEQRKVLDDYALFDAELMKWIDTKVYVNGTQVFIDKVIPESQNFNWAGSKQGHTLTAIFDQEFYNNSYPTHFVKLKKGRIMWLRRRVFTMEQKKENQEFSEGFYMFGGMNEKGVPTNDLFLIEPYLDENEKILGSQTLEYAAKPVLSIEVSKVQNFSGKPPSARISHSAMNYRDYRKHQYLVIYGGRNDSIYSQTQNVALNDICMYNVNLREWTTIAMYSQMPCSRWSHCMATNGTSRDGFLIFGGVNLKNYCKSNVYQFQILNKPVGTDIKEQDQKLEILNSNCKDKIEMIKNILTKQ